MCEKNKLELFPRLIKTGKLSTAELHHADVPSLLHFAALYGLKGVSCLLLQCPGAERAMHTANRRGQTPTDVAKSHCHAELHVLLKETLVTPSSFGLSPPFLLCLIFRCNSSPLTFDTMRTFRQASMSDDSFSCSVFYESN